MGWKPRGLRAEIECFLSFCGNGRFQRVPFEPVAQAPVPAVPQAETAVSAAMLPEPAADPVPVKAAPVAAPAPEPKGNFMSVLKKLGNDSAEVEEEDSDVVEIKPDGPISLHP